MDNNDLSAAELRRVARVSGIRSDQLPSLEQVERRRFELWLVSSALLVALTGGVAICTCSSWPARSCGSGRPARRSCPWP
jgi:hypothetical protein